MVRESGTEVLFNTVNVTICTCPQCPVQAGSQCVAGKMSMMSEALKSNPLDREGIAGLYCATGEAYCQDIDVQQACVCESCPVFTKYDLAQGQPALYFCRDGVSR